MDIRQKVTDDIIAAMAAGTPPWRKGWTSGGLPYNASSGKVYSGVNLVILSMQPSAGADPRFLTFKQAEHQGLKVRKGAKGVQIVKMVEGGETADVVISPRPGVDGIVKGGKATAANVADVARSGVVVFVAKGAPKPDVSTPEALKRSLLAAKSITYSDPAEGGASAIHFVKVLDRLGIANEMKARTIIAKSGADVGVVVASGKAEFGVNQWQVVMSVAGIENAGPLPGDLQLTVVFASAIMAGTKDAAASKALVEFLRTPAAATVIKGKGMEPAN